MPLTSPSFAIGIARTVGATTASVQLGASPTLMSSVTIATHVTALVAGDKVLVMIPDPDDSSLTPVIVARLSGAATPYHPSVTLDDAAIQAVLDLSTQALTLDSQAANTAFMGPAAGAAADPTFRALVVADMVAHNILSATHADTTPGALARGDLLTAQGAGALLDNLAISAPAATFMNYVGAANADVEPGYKALFDATVPGTIAESAAAATGSAVVAARRDHTHGAPATWAATVHNLLSAKHGDTTVAAAVVGDIITGQAGPVFARLAKSSPAANILDFLGIANADTGPSWKTASSNPGAAVAILATDASGYVRITALGLGAAPTANMRFIVTGSKSSFDVNVDQYVGVRCFVWCYK